MKPKAGSRARAASIERVTKKYEKEPKDSKKDVDAYKENNLNRFMIYVELNQRNYSKNLRTFHNLRKS